MHEEGSGASGVELYHKLLRRDELKIRLYVMLSGDDEDLLSDYFAKGIFMDSLHRLTIRSVKLYADGALGSRGAWLLKAYSDAPGKFGHNVRDMEALDKLTLAATQAGFQVCTHAIGDRGNREVLDMYARAFEIYPEKKVNSRYRIEHAQHISSQDLIRFKNQPTREWKARCVEFVRNMQNLGNEVKHSCMVNTNARSGAHQRISPREVQTRMANKSFLTSI